jgi:hypothetical protein
MDEPEHAEELECDGADHWSIAVFREPPDGGLVVQKWAVCPAEQAGQRLAAAVRQLGEPEEEQILTAEEVAMHRAAHAGDTAIGVTVRND